MESISFLRPFKSSHRQPDGRVVVHRVSKLLDGASRVIEGFNAGARFALEERHAAPGEVLAVIAEQATKGETVFVHARPTVDGRRHLKEHGFLLRRSRPRDGEAPHMEDRPSTVLPLDIDGADLDGFDPMHPEPTFRALADAAGFPGAAVLGQLTSSQQPEKGSPARIRLYFETDAGLLARERKALQAVVEARLQAAGIEPKLDGAMARTVQIVYLALPEREGGAPDRLPQRLFILPGGVAHVDVEALRTAPLPARHGAVGEMPVGVLPPGADVLEHFLPADLPDLHGGIFRVAYHLTRQGGCSEEGLTAAIFDHVEPLIDWSAAQPRRPSREVLREEVAGVVRWVLEVAQGDTIPGVAPEFPAVERHSLAQGQKAVEAAVVAALGRRGRSIIRVTTGVGKTEELLQSAALLGLNLDVYVADHGLGAELARRSQRLGMSARVIQGRGQRDRSGKPLCRKIETEQHLVALGAGGLASAMCETPVSLLHDAWEEFKEWLPGEEVPPVPAMLEVCPYAADCAYFTQFTEPAQVVIRMHSTLAHEPSSLERKIRKADATVIDESPLPHLIETCRVPVAACTGPLAPILRPDPHVDDFDLEALKHVARRGIVTGITPGMDAAQSFAAAQGARTSGAKLAEMILDCSRAGHEELPDVRVAGGCVEATWLRPIRRFGPSTALLDATLRPAIAASFFPGAKVTTVAVQDNLAVTQVYDRTYSKSAAARGADCFQVVDEYAGHLRALGMEPGVVTHKAHHDALTEAGVPHVEHYGALRGRDGLKGLAPGILVGRIQPRLETVVQLARTLFPGVAFPNAVQVRRPAGYRMADGSLVGTEDFYVTCDGPGAGLLAEVAASMREDEMLQGLGRFRAVRAAAPLQVWIFGGLPMDVTVKELIRLQDVAEINLLLRLLREWQVVPLMPSLLVRMAPDRFGTEKAAKRWVQKGVGENAQRIVSALGVRCTQTCNQGPGDRGERGVIKAPMIYAVGRNATNLDEVRGEWRSIKAPRPTRVEEGGLLGPCSFPAPSPLPPTGAPDRYVVLDQPPADAGGRRLALVTFRLDRAHARTPPARLPVALVHAVDLLDVQRGLDRLLRKLGVRDAVYATWALPPVELDGPDVEDVAV